MVGNNVETPGLEGAEHGDVHRSPVHAQMAEVVVIEHQRHEIQALRLELGRNGLLERPRHRDDRAAAIPALRSL